MRYSYLEGKQLRRTEVQPSFDLECEILVAGLGSAGSIAAVAAAECGRTVIGIDRLSAIGGLSTAGCVWDYYYGVPGGRGQEINRACQEMNRAGYAETNKGSEYDSFSSAVRSIVLEQAALSAGCKILYKTVLLGVYLEGNHVTGIRCIQGGKQLAIRCQTLIDCTGDAQAARMAGCETQYGRSTDGMHIVSSNTTTMQVEGRFKNVWSHSSIGDCSDDREFTEINLQSSAHYPRLYDYYEEDNRTLFLGEIFGMRDGHRIVADEMITFADYATGYRTKEPVFYAASQVDDPNFDIANGEEVAQDWKLISGLDGYGITLGIPLGALLPKNMEGILVAGKGLGIGHDLQGCVRMRWDMEHSAEAAAVAASLAIAQKTTPRCLDYTVLSEEMRRRGLLNEADNVGYIDLQGVEGQGGVPVQMPRGLAQIRSALSQRTADTVFWVARNERDAALTDALRGWMAESDPILRHNSAIAAAIRGDVTALPVLREIVQAGPTVPERLVHHGFVNLPFTSALCLLGRLGSPQDAGLLTRVAENGEAMAKKMPVAPNAFYRVSGDWAFQFVSLAIASLVKLAGQHSNPQVDEWLQNWLKNGVCPQNSRGGLYLDSIHRIVRNFLDTRPKQVREA